MVPQFHSLKQYNLSLSSDSLLSFRGLFHFENNLKPIHRDFLLQLKIMKAIESRMSEKSNFTKKNQKFEPVSIMKKLRSKIPRRKRFQISPILGESSSNSLYRVEKRKPNDEVSSVLIPDEISCTSNLISVGSETLQEFKLSLKQQQEQKKKQVVVSKTENCSDDRRILTRYCYKQKEIEETATEKVSESHSCGVVFSGDEFSGRKWKSRARKVDENDEGGNNRNVSEAISFSETSCIQSVYSSIKNSRKNSKSEEEFTSNDSVAKKAKVEIQGGESVSEIMFVPKSNSELKNENEFVGDEIRAPVASISDLSRNYCKVESNLKFADSESTAINQKPEDFESDCELVCSEEYSYGAEESDYSKTISDLDSEFSDYVGSSLYDSESQTDFSQGSDLNPTTYYSFLTEYSKEFSRLSFVASSDCKISSQIHKDYSEKLTVNENHEDSYTKFRRRERNHVILKDYFEDYYTTTDYGDFLLQQRQAIVNWITDVSSESGLRELNLETVFLCVSLMDRFLSQGFFKTKRKLQLLGIACLTLATRIEENQMYNCIRQKTFQIGSDVYSRCEVVAMEWLVQEILNFQCFLPTTYNLLWFYLKAARADQEMEDTAKYLAVLSLMDPDLLCYWPSTVAAGLVILSALVSNKDSSCQFIMETHVRTYNDDLPECIESLEWMVKYVS
ncbi:cyclin-SDS-like [Papaver somniferum]|uniref:cyclin-SDS-like n=1 Tax=Papaver somniferum TaxID=3469 RepID=UPI000E6FAEAB|nr:cyclin-SDS-like [Papaver somniferum]